MIKTLLDVLEPYTNVEINFHRTKHGMVITMWNKVDTVREVIRDTDSEEYITLLLFDMLDYLGYTPARVNDVKDII